jgi:ABC-2 type transport system ATP-binding protein
MTDLSVDVRGLGRIYKTRGTPGSPGREFAALTDLSLEVRQGELFGLLGPNGAGKTTLIKILTTLLAPTSGSARVAGYDVAREPSKVRQRINMVSGGESSGYGLLTVRENLWMFAQFYGISSGEANRRIETMLGQLGMSDRLRTKSSELSTGLRQKMNIVRGFLTDPEVLFLDEPTLGLDVGASRDVRTFVRGWMEEDRSRTLLLTTHYMVEADELCDRIAIINQGRVLACDTPANLKKHLQGAPIFHLQVTPVPASGMEHFQSIPGLHKITHHPGDGRSSLELILDREDALHLVLGKMAELGIRLLSLEKREPTLEDVFVELVGRSMEEMEHDSTSP